MAYTVNGIELETDEQGYLLEPDYSEEVVRVIAAAENIELTDEHWKVVAWLRDQYREHGHTPNFRNMLKAVAQDVLPGCDSKALYDLFPIGPAKQGCKVAGLPQPLGKGGY
jgi:tRNA 2-thiouridine synthesizing protein E